MRRLKVNKKSLLRKGGTPAPQMTMDTDSILQGIREKLQGGISEVEVFQNLMEQQIPLDEIQTAFTALGYDDTMLSNIMTKVQEATDKSSEDIQEGSISGSSLPQAQAGNIGITPGMAFSGALQMPTSGFFGTVSTANTDQVTGYRPAKNFYLPQDLGNYGNVDGALGVLAQGFQNLFSKQDTDGDGLMDGTFRDTRAKRHRQKDRRGSYYDYEVTFDEGDSADNYYASNQDLFKGKLRTKEQAAQDFLNNSKVNYNVNTGQYETVWNPYQDKFLNSADNQLKKRLSKNKDLSGPMLNVINDGISISEFQQRLADNPAHAELLAQDLGIIKGDRLPAGVSYGVDKDGSAGSYFGANPYLYETMMLDNVYSGDASKDYQLSDFNLKGTSVRNQNTNPPSNDPPSNDPPSNNPPSSNVDYSYLDPTLNTIFDFEQTLGGFDDVTGKAYGLSNLGANRYTGLNPNDPDYLDPKDPNFRANLRERVKRDYASSLQGFDKSLQPAMLDFAYNTGRDPRIYLLDQYIKSQGNPAGLDDRGAYKDAMKNFSWTDPNMQSRFDQVYGDNAAAISALPVADQIKLMNQGRQFYYNNINMVGGKPNPAAAATWLQRPFYKAGGTVDVGGGSIDMGKIDSRSIDVKNLDSASIQKAQFGFDLKGYIKGEQGLIPDYKGESTTKTVNKAVDKYGDKVSTGLDVAQTAMSGAGMFPVVGNVVDLVNAGVSGARSTFANYTGDKDGAIKHAENMAINLGSSIPGPAGWAAGATSIAKDVAGYTGVMNDKSIASNVGIETERPLVDSPVKTGPTKTVASMGYELPYYQGAGETKKERKNRIKNYNHPYLQEYIELFKQNNKSDETAIKDIMSQMGVTGQDTLFLGNSPSLSGMTMRPEFNLDLFLASQKDPDAFNAGQPVNVTYEDREKYDIDDRTYMNDVGNYLHLIKSSLNQKQDGGANTLYEYYTGIGQDLPTIPQRADIYNLSGGNDQYTGTAAQNTQLLKFLKESGPITMLDEVEIVGKKNDNNSMPTNDDPQDFSLLKDPVGPLANNDFSGIENESNLITEPGQLTANLINNQALPGGDGSGDLTDDGTATTQITDFDVISDANTFVPNPTGTDTDPPVDPPVDPEFKDPKIKRKNKLMGTINRIKDSQAVKKFADLSGFAVAGAGVINEMFQNKKAREAEESLPFLTMADKAYGMVEEREGDRGLFDENTGIAQPDNIRAYEAQMGTETFMMPPMKQEENIVDLDYETVARLISAGADIEIL